MKLVLLIHILEDKSDLENSVMQKKIKIPKLSLNHVEEDGEAKDYGEEDLQLRHIKVTKSFFFVEVCGGIFRFLTAKECQSGLSPDKCPLVSQAMIFSGWEMLGLASVFAGQLPGSPDSCCATSTTLLTPSVRCRRY